MRTSIPLFLVAASVPGAVPAQNMPTPVTVRYGDLDLRTTAGVRTFDRRLLSAVRDVCGDDLTMETGSRMAARRCRAAKLVEIRALRDAVVARKTGMPPEVAAAR
ncbi:UrcA family protein [Sphingomonas sp.]|uniref:UrcA family protein n=1 Tax=Sphingomonas sp. TaxID=28214 RepID=UPI003B3B0E82